MGTMGRAHENAAQRIPSAAVEEGTPGIHRAADGSVLLRRRLTIARRVRPRKQVMMLM